MSSAVEEAPLRVRPVRCYCAGGKETRGVQKWKHPLKMSAHVIFCFLYINYLMDNNVPRLLMSQTSWTWERNCTVPSMWLLGRKHQRGLRFKGLTQKEDKSRTSAFALRTPERGPRYTINHRDCTPTVARSALQSDHIKGRWSPSTEPRCPIHTVTAIYRNENVP